MTRSSDAPPDADSARRFGRLYAGLTDDEPTAAGLAAQRARLLMRARAERFDASTSFISRIFSPSSSPSWGADAAQSPAGSESQRGPSPNPLRAAAWGPNPTWFLPSQALRFPALALATALAVWLGGTLWSTDAPILKAKWRGETVREGAELSTEPGNSGSALGFSDGSRVVLEANTQGQVITLAEKQTVVRLHRGQVAADVNRQTGTSWDILAGPYRVSVIGTKFTVNWEPATERFEVHVDRGQVRVAGGGFDDDGLSLTAGQTVVRSRAPAEPADESEARAASTSDRDLTALEGTAATDPSASTESALRPEARQTSRRVRPNGDGTSGGPTQNDVLPPATHPSWKELAEHGKYVDAFKLASAAGFGSLLASEGPEGLLLLANASRYAGRSQSARAAYETLRKRHSESSEARIAAFYLARLAQDATQQPRSAVQWLRTYLRESPRGPLAASARARLIDTLLQLGDESTAKEVARDYIRLHPQGSHIGLARSLIRDSDRRRVAGER